MRVENDVLNVLDRADKEGNLLKLVGQLDRPLYTKTNKVLEALGGKWNRKMQGHVFDGDAADAVDAVILTGEIASTKTKAQQFGYFPTPRNVVDRLMEIAQVKPGMLVMEPSAGQGAIATALLDAGIELVAYELMDTNCDILDKAVGDHPKCDKSIVVQKDFLSVDPSPIFDRVVMNPPFDKQADIRHVLHALKFLKPGGLLVSVMAAGVVFRDNKLTTEFRELIRARGGDIEALPEGSFKESGTGVNTVIVTIPQ